MVSVGRVRGCDTEPLGGAAGLTSWLAEAGHDVSGTGKVAKAALSAFYIRPVLRE